MVDPTSDLEEDVDPADAPQCGACGDPIVDDPEHRVVTWVEEGGIEAVHFCDEACRADWDDPR